MPRRITLHNFQSRDANRLCPRFVDHKVFAIIYATGAGKTLEIRAIVSRLYHHRYDPEYKGFSFTHCIFAAPQRVIRDNFIEDISELVDGNLVYPCLNVVTNVSREDLERFLGQRWTVDRMCMAVTHSIIVRLIPWLEEALRQDPSFLVGKILVIDEAHHIPAKRLAQLCRLWKDHGGHLVLLTATPSHPDIEKVIPDNAIVACRTLPEQMEGGKYAPQILETGIINVTGEGYSDKEMCGIPVDADTAIQEIVDDYEKQCLEAKCKPRALVIIRPRKTREENRKIIERFLECFEAKGDLNGLGKIRPVVGVGAHKSVIGDVSDCIAHDKAIHSGEQCTCSKCRGLPYRRLTFKDSNYDVLILIGRGREGLDTVLASHMYLFGLCHFLPSVGQLLGRIMRWRKEVLDYPDKWRNRSYLRIITAGVKNLAAHSQQVLLTMHYLNLLGLQQWSVLSLVSRIVDKMASKAGHPRLGGKRIPYITLEKRAAILTYHSEMMKWYNEGSSQNERNHGAPLNKVLTRNEQAKLTLSRIELGCLRLKGAPKDKITEAEILLVLTDLEASFHREQKEALQRELWKALEELLPEEGVMSAVNRALVQVASSFREATLSYSLLASRVQQEILSLTTEHIEDFSARLDEALKNSTAQAEKKLETRYGYSPGTLETFRRTIANHPPGVR